MSEIKYSRHVFIQKINLYLYYYILVIEKKTTNLFELNLKAYMTNVFFFFEFNDIFATLTYIYIYIYLFIVVSRKKN